jgi:hypothetical protein
MTATNTGSLQLRNLVFSIPTVTNLACVHKSSNLSQTEDPLTSSVVLELDAVVTCTGNYSFTQDDIEQPPKVVHTTATCSTAKGVQTFTSNDASVAPINSPAMRVDIQQTDCQAMVPSRARELTVGHAPGWRVRSCVTQAAG